MCYRDPSHIRCAVVIAVVVQANKLGVFLSTRDIKNWPRVYLNKHLEVYGDIETIQLLWAQSLDWIRDEMDEKLVTEDNPNQYIIKPQELSNYFIIFCERYKLLYFNRKYKNSNTFNSWGQGEFCYDLVCLNNIIG